MCGRCWQNDRMSYNSYRLESNELQDESGSKPWPASQHLGWVQQTHVEQDRSTSLKAAFGFVIGS